MSPLSRRLVAGVALSTALCSAPPSTAAAPAARPDDEAMTCGQIATELQPYVQQMVPNIQALGASNAQLYAQGRQMADKRRAEEAMLLPLAQAGALDPTGASKRAYQAAQVAQNARERAENEAFLNSPLARQNKAQSEQLAAQAQEMKSNERLQRLMQLAQEQHCDKR